MAAYLRGSNANLGGAFVTSAESDALYDDARVRPAPTSPARGRRRSPSAPNMTTLNFLLAHAVARTLKPGDEIVVTQLDHDANVSPWLRMRRRPRAHRAHRAAAAGRRHARPRRARGGARPDRTKIVAFTLASNAVGTMPDARRISDVAHAVGALAWADVRPLRAAPPHRPRRAGRSTSASARRTSSSARTSASAAIRHDLAARWPADRVRPADETPGGPPLRDGHADARGAGRLRRRGRVPRLARARVRRAEASGSTPPSRASSPTRSR